MTTQITKYRVEGLNKDDETIFRIAELETPIFYDTCYIVNDQELHVSIRDQLNCYIIDNDEINIKDYIDNNDIKIVLNWNALLPMEEKLPYPTKDDERFEKLLSVLDEIIKGESFVDEIAAHHNKIREDIKYLSLNDQLKIVLNSMKSTSISGKDVYNMILQIIDKKTSKE